LFSCSCVNLMRIQICFVLANVPSFVMHEIADVLSPPSGVGSLVYIQFLQEVLIPI